jgi:hypothetical protein
VFLLSRLLYKQENWHCNLHLNTPFNCLRTWASKREGYVLGSLKRQWLASNKIFKSVPNKSSDKRCQTYEELLPKLLPADNSSERLLTQPVSLYSPETKQLQRPLTCFRVLMLSWIGLGSPTTVFVSLEKREGLVLSPDTSSPWSPHTKSQENELQKKLRPHSPA